MTARTLQPEDQIAHYRIVGPLGAGGMGEVYLAQDQTLERSVALKILPRELVQSEDRVRRFVREAKSASSLNHPNIVTIYEIGQDEVRGHEKDPSSSSLHYISMELVSGETLSTKIHQDKTDLRTLLGYLAQAAEGLAKAHAAGIVHRDLKPSNIMVSKDGYAKVLDFGLAKLTEKQPTDADMTSGPDAEDGTSAGAVVGTVAYMSPEQVRGSSVDHRSDIFSFGSILYEAATRKQAFIAGSHVETMHRVLHDKPTPVEELNKEAPAELRRVIRRCLAKNPDQRLQSAKDLAIELREIVDEYDTLPGSGSSGSGSSALGAAPPRKGIPPAALIAGALVIAAVIVGGVLMLRRGGDRGGPSSAIPMKIATVARRGATASTNLSPDGRYLAYVQSVGTDWSMWVRQVATGSDVQTLSGQKYVPYGLSFTPDGNYLYYLNNDPDRTGYKALFEIPTLGGTPRKRTYDVDSRVTFSPDGKQICFWRGEPQKNRDVLVVFDLERGRERVLASASPPLSLGPPAWSPDGKRIAAVATNGGVAEGSSIVTFRVADGRREPVGKNAWFQITDVTWLPDGSGLLVSAFDRSTFAESQLWTLGYPDGHVRRITSDANKYLDLSISADGTTIAATRARQEANLWLASPSGARNVRQVTFGSREESPVGNFDPGPDSTIFYDTVKDGSAQIWSVGADGTGPKPITSGPDSDPRFRPGTGVFFFRAEKDMTIHIWYSDVNGENARQVTSGKGEMIVDVSPDGHTVLFTRNDTPEVLWSISSDGGEPTRLSPSSGQAALFSPDGARIAHTLVETIDGRGAYTAAIMPAKGGGPTLKPALPPRIGNVSWTPDGNGLTYLHASNALRNLFRLRLNGGKQEEITKFTDGRIRAHRWSPDGKRILFCRRIDNADNLWITNADGSNPVAVTDFETGAIFNIKWSRDGSRIIFTYGEFSQSAVLIRNFK